MLSRKGVILVERAAPGKNLGPGDTIVALGSRHCGYTGVEFRQVYVVLHHPVAFLLRLHDSRFTNIPLLLGIYRPCTRSLSSIPNTAQTFAYLKKVGNREPSGSSGHNPLGVLSVIAMILLLTAQVSSGLFIVSDDYFESAPLAYLVSDAASNRLTWWHHLLSKFILVVVGLHVAAIFYYLIWKKENLIKPMITGWKWVKSPPDREQ